MVAGTIKKSDQGAIMEPARRPMTQAEFDTEATDILHRFGIRIDDDMNMAEMSKALEQAIGAAVSYRVAARDHQIRSNVSRNYLLRAITRIASMIQSGDHKIAMRELADVIDSFSLVNETPRPATLGGGVFPGDKGH